jgi:prophage tail gpP-like protein
VTVIDDTDASFATFSFETTEVSKVPATVEGLQVAPGDHCEIFLAGQLALTGHVKERQVGYAGRQHDILISGTSTTFNVATSSILPKSNGNYDGMDLTALAKRAAGYHGVKVKTIGQIPGMPFDHMQHNLGELTYNFIERACRMRNVKLGTDAEGNLLLIGPHEAMPSGQLIEGKNILRAACVIRDTHFFQRYASAGQLPSHDERWGDEANKGVAELAGKSKLPIYFTTFADTPPGSQQELVWRTETSRRVFEGSEIQANISVQGWVQGNGSLWRARETYHVKSPMLILDQPLTCKKITYDQRDGAGTTTTMELVNPLYMNQHAPFAQPNAASVPIAKTDGVPTSAIESGQVQIATSTGFR